MTTDPTTARPRADKARNRSHILEVAEQFFAEEGVTGSLEAIAKRAGVGAGTLYRHFPSREALIAALLDARYNQLFDRRDEIERDETDAGHALERWLDALYDFSTVFDGLPAPLREALHEESSPLANTCGDFTAATDHFLTAAQREGRARPWIRGQDLFLGVLAAAWASNAALADDSSTKALRSVQQAGWMTRPHDV